MSPPRLAARRLIAAICLVSAIVAPPTAAGESFAGAGPWVVRAWFGDEAMVREVASWGEHFAWYPEKGFLVAEVDGEHLGRLRALGFFVEEDVERTAHRRRFEAAVAAGPTGGGIPGFPCYRTVEETFAAAQALAAARPDLVSVVDAGDSWEKAVGPGPGYDLLVLRLSNAAVPGPKPVFLATAAIHAREYVTAEAALRFAEGLVAAHGHDADATWLVDHHEFHLVLHTNPDGRKQAEGGLLWRKNTNQAYCGATSDLRGADLNRNFDFYWGAWGGSSADPCSETFRGAAPASEPETQAIQAYMAQVLVDQRPDDLTTPAPDDTTGVYADLHSFQPALLTPFGLTAATGDVCLGANLPPNCEGLLRLGRKWGRLSAWDPRTGGLYPVDGSTKDYAYGRFGVPAYTWEMGTDFFESCESFGESVAGPGREMLRYALRVARAPYLEPRGPDVYRVEALPGAVSAGTAFELTAQAADGRVFDEETGQPEPVQAIAEARAWIDEPPWQPGAPSIALAAADGAFDEPVEALAGTLDSSALAAGLHLVYVRARDAAGDWGAVSAALLAVVDPADDPVVQGSVVASGSAAPLAATVSIGPFATRTDPLTGAYALRVPAGTWDVVARAELHASRVVEEVVAAPGATIPLDFALPVPLFADDGEGGDAGWTAQPPWALRTDDAFSGSHSWSDSAASYADNVNVAITSPIVDLTEATEAILVYRQLYLIEGSYDFGWVEVSTNGGASWTLAARVSGAVSWDWEWVELPLPALAGAAQARIRFRLTSDGGVVRDGWHLDDIALTGLLPTVEPPMPFLDGFETGDASRWSSTVP